MLRSFHSTPHHVKRRWVIALSTLAMLAVVAGWVQYVTWTIRSQRVALTNGHQLTDDQFGPFRTLRSLGASVLDVVTPNGSDTLRR